MIPPLMVRSHWFLGFFLLFLLPVTLRSQPDNGLAIRMKNLQKAPQQDTLRVNVLLAIGSYYLQKRGEIKADLDSAWTYMEQASVLADSLQFKNQIYSVTKWKARYFLEKKDFTQCWSTLMQSIKRYHESGEKEQEASLWYIMGSLLRTQESFADESIGYLRNAMALYRQSGAKLNEIKTLKEIADAHFGQGKLNESETELLEVLDRYKAIGFKNLHYSYDLLAAVATKKGNMNQALFYGLETIKSMEASGDSNSAVVFYYRLGEIYAELGQTDQSIAWYRKCCDKKVGPVPFNGSWTDDLYFLSNGVGFAENTRCLDH